MTLAQSPARALPLFYASGCIFASTWLLATGDNRLYMPMHITFMASVLPLCLMRGFCMGFITPLRSWQGAFIATFLFYALIMALLHSDSEVSSDYTRDIVVRVFPGLLIGYVAFAPYGRQRDRMTRRRKLLDLAAVLTFGGVLYASYQMLVPMVRTDLFLLKVDIERVPYQLFGIYLVLALVVTIRVIEPYSSRSMVKITVLSALLSAFAVAVFLLSQMVGSNSAAALAIALVFAVLISNGLSYLKTGTAMGLLRAGLVGAVASSAILWLVTILPTLPPIRIFNFGG